MPMGEMLTTGHNGFCCPACGSENTSRYSAIHEGGVSRTQSSSTHTAVAYGGGGFIPVLGSSSTTGVHQTELARKTAPPDRRFEYGVEHLLLGWLVSFVLAFIVWLGGDFALSLAGWKEAGDPLPSSVIWVCFGLLALLPLSAYVNGREAKEWNRTEHPKLLQEWRNRWLCLRCGESFVPKRADSPMPSSTAISSISSQPYKSVESNKNDQMSPVFRALMLTLLAIVIGLADLVALVVVLGQFN